MTSVLAERHPIDVVHLGLQDITDQVSDSPKGDGSEHLDLHCMDCLFVSAALRRLNSDRPAHRACEALHIVQDSIEEWDEDDGQTRWTLMAVKGRRLPAEPARRRALMVRIAIEREAFEFALRITTVINNLRPVSDRACSRRRVNAQTSLATRSSADVDPVCMCEEGEPGPCRQVEIERRRVRLGPKFVAEHAIDTEEGCAEAVLAAAHTWHDWVSPHDDDAMCDQFNQQARVIEMSDKIIVVVDEPGSGCWIFEGIF